MPDISYGMEGISLNLVMDITFYVILGGYLIFTAIVYYHWDSYATDKAISRFTLLSYFITTLPLLLVMGVMILIV